MAAAGCEWMWSKGEVRSRGHPEGQCTKSFAARVGGVMYGIRKLQKRPMTWRHS